MTWLLQTQNNLLSHHVAHDANHCAKLPASVINKQKRTTINLDLNNQIRIEIVVFWCKTPGLVSTRIAYHSALINGVVK